jgi:hypothetical protein
MRDTLATGARAVVVNVNGNSISHLLLYAFLIVVGGFVGFGLSFAVGFGEKPLNRVIFKLVPLFMLLGAAGGGCAAYGLLQIH